MRRVRGRTGVPGGPARPPVPRPGGPALHGLPTGSRRPSPNWGGSYPIWGCSRAGSKRSGSAKRSAKVPERDHKKRAPCAAPGEKDRPMMSPLVDIPRCNRSFTIPRRSSCKSAGDLPSSRLSGRRAQALKENRTGRLSGGAAARPAVGRRSRETGIALEGRRPAPVELVRSRSGP